MTDKKIAIVYDWMDKWGGVERVLLVLKDLYPQADWYTSYIDRHRASWAKDWPVTTSFLQNFPGFIKNERVLSFPFYPYAFESFNFTGYDLVISVTSSFAKSVITHPGTRHVCYLLTPTRYFWGMTDQYIKTDFVTNLLMRGYRNWDKVAAKRPDKIISISQTVADRCQKYYHRNSTVIYPPFDIRYWERVKFRISTSPSRLSVSKPYYLVVSRLEPYKKVDLVVKSFDTLPDKQLVVVGEGTQLTALQKLAGKNIHFLNQVSDEELARLYTHAEALIMPQEEDFGYVALEAQFFGCPVISYNKGGASETVQNELGGLFFSEQTSKSLLNILAKYHTISYNLKNKLKTSGISHLEKFSRTQFEKQFTAQVTESI